MKEKLLKEGYRRFEQPSDEPTLYQKKVSDRKGIKYFINCYHYFLQGKMDSWDYKLQIEIKAGTVNIILFNTGVTIEELELFFESTWKNYGACYYEEFGENKLEVKDDRWNW